MEPVLKLEPEHGCWASIHWRIEMPIETDFDLLTRRILAEAYEARCDCPMLKVLRSREGHEIILVPRTGRTQIRVSTEVPEGQRSAQAEVLFSLLRTCFQDVSPAADEAPPSRIGRARYA
jgi:hypothetical protein